MSVFTIKANVVRAAQIFQAKQDVRYYLNGVYVGKDGTICGTNGYAAFISKHEAEVEHDLILRVDGLVPKTADTLEVTSLDDGTHRFIIDCLSPYNKTIKRLCGVFVDGKYPDVKSKIPDHSDEALSKFYGENTLCLQTDYVKMTGDVFGKNGFTGIKIKFTDQNSPMTVEPVANAAYPDGTVVLIMPVKGG